MDAILVQLSNLTKKITQLEEKIDTLIENKKPKINHTESKDLSFADNLPNGLSKDHWDTIVRIADDTPADKFVNVKTCKQVTRCHYTFVKSGIFIGPHDYQEIVEWCNLNYKKKDTEIEEILKVRHDPNDNDGPEEEVDEENVGSKNEEIESKEWYNECGQLHRENNQPTYIDYCESGEKHDQPAHIAYYENGKIHSKKWCINGKLHREGDKPAEIKYYQNGMKQTERWYLNGIESRSDGKPVRIDYNKAGNVEMEIIRLDENSEIRKIYDENGKIQIESWYKNEKRHRENDKPAMIEYRDGNISRESWYKNGLIHREDNPAIIVYKKDGRILEKKWCINGILLKMEGY